ncbi:methanethiol oxidase [Planococcus citri]|uniref:methanethiol oxidase n=1 Tax=Planococcus citri TaxID=170843 RepID=UPI0031FA29F0
MSQGPGFASPQDAIKFGEREKLLYTICICPEPSKNKRPDYFAVIDVDPQSPTYSQVIHRVHMPNIADELHHFGYNACSGCYGIPGAKRSRIVIPALNSDRIYFLNAEDPKKPYIEKTIEPEEIHKLGVTAMHTTHCAPTGDILISALGDKEGNGLGEFVVIDGQTLELKGTWTKGKKAKFGYDFWYQPFHDVLIASEWGAPKSFRKGLNIDDAANPDLYGQSLNVYSWSKHTLEQVIDLGKEGGVPLEIRFLHNPKADQGFVGCALQGKIFRFFRKPDGTWDAEKAIDVPVKTVEGWFTPEFPGLITDILISMDDKYLYFSNWLHGDIRQYDITDPKSPKLVGQIFLGGKLQKDSNLKLLEDPENHGLHDPVYVKGRRLHAAPQMFQLSLDGKRMYVTTSLFSPWDEAIYPESLVQGATMVKIDVNTETGGLTLDPDFLIDFGKEPDGPALAHEIRYPGGDCTSDIFMADQGIQADQCCCRK